MKPLCRVLLASACCFSAIAKQNTSPAETASHPPAAQVVIDGIDLVDAGTDHIAFGLQTHATSSHTMKARRISFEDMHVGGVPVYLGEIEGPLDLKAGQDFPLPNIPLNIYFRDLDSLAPVERAVRNEQIGIQGRARVEFDLKVLQKLALRQWSGRTTLSIDQSIPLAVPGGELGRFAALAALRAADTALSLASSTLGSLRRSQEDWTQALDKRYRPALILAESRYTLMTQDGRRLDMVQDGVGFRIPNRQFVLTSEMLSPWKFDPEVATMLQNHEATLVPESVDLLVWPGDIPVEPANALSLSRGLIRVLQARQEDETMEMPREGGYDRIRVSKRDSGRNLAILEFTTSDGPSPVLPQAATDRIRSDSWERVAVFRFSGGTHPELVFCTAHRAGDRLILDTPVDESAFGSPVITPQGAVAMLQNQNSAALLNRLF